MKTFDDAVKLGTFAIAPQDTSVDALIARVEERTARFASLIEEAKASTHLRAFIDTTEQIVRQGDLSIEAALFTAFVQGLMTGIEMEKVE